MLPRKIIVAGPVYLSLTTESNSLTAATLPDQGLDAESVTHTVSGRAAVTAIALHHFGVPVHLVGKVGDDRFGRAVVNHCKEVSPELVPGIVLDPSTRTGVTIHDALQEGVGATQNSPGANNTFYASDIPRADLQQGDLFHFTDPAAMRSVYRDEGGELLSILQRARREGLTTSLDLYLPELSDSPSAVDWALVLENCLRYIDVLIIDGMDLVRVFKPDFSDQPIGEVLSPDLLGELSGKIISSGVEIILVRLGSQGVYLRTAPSAAWKKAGRALEGFGEVWQDQTLWLPALKGDDAEPAEGAEGLVPGFLGSLLRGEAPKKAILTASAAQASPEAGSWEELQAQLSESWTELPLQVAGEGWRKEGPHEA
jgi:sugar/nucleoside kinase (ribokinase family)